MRYLRQNTATRITVGPFLDKTDGITPEVALTVTSEKLTLVVDDGGVPTLVLDTAPTASGGANDMVHITGDEAGLYDLELAAANVNYVGRALLALTDAATHCPVFHEFTILPANVYDSLIGGSDLLQVDVTQLGGGAQSLTDLKDFADDGYDPSANKVQGVVLVDTVTTYTGNTPQTGDAYARLGAPAGASTAADIAAVKTQTAAIETDTQDIQGRLPASLVSGRMDSSVGAMAANTVTASALAADAVTEIQSGLATSAALATVDGVVDAIQATTDKIDDTLEDDGGTYRFTANALEESPAGGGAPTAGEIADAVWEEAISDHSGTTGSTAEALNAAGAAGDPWTTALPGSYGAGSAGKIIGDNLNASVGSRATQASVDTIDDFLDTEVAAIKAKTDNLPSDPADASDIAAAFSGVNTKLDTIDDFLDTEIAAIKAKTDNLPASPAASGEAASALASYDPPTKAELDAAVAPLATASALSTAAGNITTILADTNELQTDLVNGGRIDLLIDAIKAKTDNLPASPAASGEAASALASYDPPTIAELDAAVAPLPTAAQNADKLLGRALAGGADGGRTVQDALRPLRNKVDTVSEPGYVLVMEEDDSTEAWRAALTTDAAAEPIVTVDPT